MPTIALPRRVQGAAGAVAFKRVHRPSLVAARRCAFRCRAEVAGKNKNVRNPAANTASSNGAEDSGSAKPSGFGLVIDKSKVAAVAAKISAARELARRLAEEKQAAGASVKMDEADVMKRAAEVASAAAAAQAARADAIARAVRRAESASPQAAELNVLRAENKALKGLLLELAANRASAEGKLSELEKQFAALLLEKTPVGTIPTAKELAEPSTAVAAIAAPAAAEVAAKPAAEAPAAAKPTQLVKPTVVDKIAEALKAALVEPSQEEKAEEEVLVEAAAAKQQPDEAAAQEQEVEEEEAEALAQEEEVELEQVEAEVVPEPSAAAPRAASPSLAASLAARLSLQRESKPPPPPPKARETVLTAAQLVDAARKSMMQGANFFSVPAAVPVDSIVSIFYNRMRGPLPGNARLRLKYGLNKWEEIEEQDMVRSPELMSVNGQEWWVIKLEVPKDVFRFDFVVVDLNSGAVDNNSAKDFQLLLIGGPSEQDLLEKRAQEYELAEKQRRAKLETEERRIFDKVQAEMLEAAGNARLAYRDRREKELIAAARAAVSERRNPALNNLQAAPKLANTYAWVNGGPRAGKSAFLVYNRRAGPLANAANVKVHLGMDGWWNKAKQTYDLTPLSAASLKEYGLKDGDWVGGSMDIAASAAMVDFVFSSGDERAWDNNGTRDYHTLVVDSLSGDQLVKLVHNKMRADAAATDKEAEDIEAKKVMRKVEIKADAQRKRRSAQQEFLYTLPFQPRPGQDIDVYYNPDLTVLRGRPEIHMRGGWNRWKHSQTLQPIKMQPAMPGGIGFVKATVKIPQDAWTLDLVFTDTADSSSGFYDNNGGLDYHIPIENKNVPHSGLHIAHIAVEMAPIAKVGGMGDVVTALGRAVKDEGHTVEVILPKYDCINYKEVKFLRQEGGFNSGGSYVRIWKGVVEGLSTTFLEPENGMFWVGCIYGRSDDAARFAFFCTAAVDYLKTYSVRPEVLHCHDWQTAPIAYSERAGMRCVFTIHNLDYRADLVGRAMATCDVATTVSPTYAREISGHPSIAPQLGKLYGIRNGIDQDIWDPSEDSYLPLAFSPDTVTRGKDAARRALREKMNLSQTDVPIVGCVTRLVAQKGIHLIKHAAWRTLERGGQFVLLGSAPDPRVQADFNGLRDALQRQYPDRARLVFQYDEPLSHLIYAGSDMFLVPSMFEPCGLTQMIAMRYGTIPVVRKTGGLNDTVFDVDHDQDRANAAGMETNGFSFDGTDTAGLDYALNRALSAWYNDRAWWTELTRRAMRADWSWLSPALDYVELYYKSLKAF